MWRTGGVPASQAESSGGESFGGGAASSGGSSFEADDDEDERQLKRGRWEQDAPSSGSEHSAGDDDDDPASLIAFGWDKCVLRKREQPCASDVELHNMSCIACWLANVLLAARPSSSQCVPKDAHHLQRRKICMGMASYNPFCVCRLRDIHRPGQGYEEAAGGSRKGRFDPKRQSALAQIRRHFNTAAGGAGQATDSAPASPPAQERAATPEAAAPAAGQPPDYTAAAGQTAALGGGSAEVEVVNLLNDSEPQSQDSPGGPGAHPTAGAAVPRVWVLRDSEPQSEGQGLGPDAQYRLRSQRQALLSESDDEGGLAPEPEAHPDEVAAAAAPAQHALSEHSSLASAGETPQQRRRQSAATLTDEPEPYHLPESQQVETSPGGRPVMSPASSPLSDRENSTPNVAAAATPSDSISQQLAVTGRQAAAKAAGEAVGVHSAGAAQGPAAPATSPVAGSGLGADADAFYESPSSGLVMSPYAMKLHREGVLRRKSRH